MANHQTPGKLSNKQAIFVEEYLIDMNASAAARRAGFSESTATKTMPMCVGENRNKCPERLRHVWDAVQAARAARKAAVRVEAQDILIRLKEMMEADIGEAFDECGNLKDIKDMPRPLRELLTGMDVTEVMDEDSQRLALRVKKPRFTKKLEVLELLGKHIGVQAFKERVDHHHEVDIVEAIRRGRKRAGKA